MAEVQRPPWPLPHPRAWMALSVTPSRAQGRRKRRASLLGSLTEPSTNLCPDLLLRGKTVPQVSQGSRVLGVAGTGGDVAAVAEEEEGSAAQMLMLAPTPSSKMQLGSLQLPTKLQAAVQQQLLQVTGQVTDQATEEDEVGEVSAAIAVTKVEAVTRLTSGLHSLSLLLRKASNLCLQTVVVAGISLLLGAA